ncbi:Cytosolic copper metallochaperone [Orobanche gracilis]
MTQSQTVVLKVAMSCGGCVGAVKRVLEKMEAVESFDIVLEEQKVTVKVKDNVQPDEVLQVVSKTGKKTCFWEEKPPAPEPPTVEPEAKGATEPELKPAETVNAA